MPSSSPEAPASSRPLRCFLVEDSLVIRQNLAATMEDMLNACIVGMAEDAASAVGWMQDDQQECDLMIIDIFLKSGTGLEVLQQAQRLRPSMRRVVLTNYATADMRRRCTELGADRVFDKSGELEELLAYCAAMLAQPPAPPP